MIVLMTDDERDDVQRDQTQQDDQAFERVDAGDQQRHVEEGQNDAHPERDGLDRSYQQVLDRRIEVEPRGNAPHG